MRIHLLTAVLLAGVSATPALAQREPTVDQRVNRLEQQMRAVQRRVFPNGNVPQVEPEIRPGTAAPTPPAATGSAISDLNARVDALESQLAALTGQVEENAFRTRQIEEALGRLRDDSNARLGRLETAAAAPPQPAAEPAVERPVPQRAPARTPAPRTPAASVDPDTSAPATATPAAPTDAVQEAYNAGFRLWQERRYEEAQTALKAVADRNPRSRWASWARNLEGRAYLDDNKPATAARVFLSNYQDNPQGERAADSLYYLGRALTQLNRKPEACRVYDELAQVFPNPRAEIRDGLPAARRAASCSN
jgi:TolA-binding protein